MSTATRANGSFEFTGRHMLICMVGFFGVIVAVNITMAMLASDSWTGLVVKNSYVASQQFNEELQNAKAQQAAGYSSTLAYHNGMLVFVLKDAEGNRLTVTDLVAEIGRPAFEQEDRKLSLIPGPDYTYKLSVDLEPGVWALTLRGKTSGSLYRRDARLHVQANGKGRFQ